MKNKNSTVRIRSDEIRIGSYFFGVDNVSNSLSKFLSCDNRLVLELDQDGLINIHASNGDINKVINAQRSRMQFFSVLIFKTIKDMKQENPELMFDRLSNVESFNDILLLVNAKVFEKVEVLRNTRFSFTDFAKASDRYADAKI